MVVGIVALAIMLVFTLGVMYKDEVVRNGKDEEKEDDDD